MPIQGKKEGKQRAGNAPKGALAALVLPSPELAHIVGSKPLSRGDATKRLWDYIRKHDLQDPENRRQVRADDNLRPIFDGKDSLNMFEMTAYVSRHLRKT